MSSYEVTISTPMNSLHQRSAADWIGAVVFIGIAIWTLITGWLPVLSESILAAILLLPNWITPILNAIGFLNRQPLVAAHRAWVGRLTSHVVTFSLPIYFALMGKSLHIRATHGAFLLAVLVGVCAGVYMVWGAWVLRNSWSIEPQARKLVTTGPFEYSRHPLYTSYMLRNIAAAVLYLDLRVAGFLLIWTALLLYRIRCEEHVLTECYPEYRQYSQRVWMFSPCLLHSQEYRNR